MHASLRHYILTLKPMSPYHGCTPLVVTVDHCTFLASLPYHLLRVNIKRAVASSVDGQSFFLLLTFLCQQHKSHVEEPFHNRPLNDRKRKFVDTELAQDTEGNVVDVTEYCKCKYVRCHKHIVGLD